MKPYKVITNAMLLLLLNISMITICNAQTISLTGDWKVNSGLSDFGTQPKSYAPDEFKIGQNQNTIDIAITDINGDKTIHSSEQLKFDGSSTATTFPSGKKKTASIQWSADKKALIETAQYFYTDKTGKAGQFKSIENFTLSEDNKTLIYTREVISDTVNFKIKVVYNKVD